MADKLGWNSGIPINRFFERKDEQDVICERLDRVQTARAPRPDLGTDVVDNSNPQPFDAPCEGEIEVRKVDDDEGGRTLATGSSHETSQRPERPRDLRQSLGKSGYRQAPVVGDEPSAGSGELRSPETRDTDIRHQVAKLTRERTGIEIAGWFAA